MNSISKTISLFVFFLVTATVPSLVYAADTPCKQTVSPSKGWYSAGKGKRLDVESNSVVTHRDRTAACKAASARKLAFDPIAQADQDDAEMCAWEQNFYSTK
jgi:hypothetical protein